jgi:Zn finger protein HypA/HybF involved in hydrogenase expression
LKNDKKPARCRRTMDVYEASERVLHEALEIVHGVEVKHKKRAKVKKITIGVGELSGLDMNKLASTIGGLIEESVLDYCEIELVKVPGQVACRCGFNGEPRLFEMRGETLAECPKCRKTELVVHGGEGVLVQKVELA